MTSKSRDLVIFDNDDNNRSDYFTLCTCVQSNTVISFMPMHSTYNIKFHTPDNNGDMPYVHDSPDLLSLSFCVGGMAYETKIGLLCLEPIDMD